MGKKLSIRDEVAALKRERVIAAAVELFYDRGYENTTLEAVAEELGVTKPFIYAHFSSKSELLAEICGRGIAKAKGTLDAVLALDCSPTERLHRLGQGFVTSVLQNQKHIAIFAREEKNLSRGDLERIGAMRREFDRKLAALLSEGVTSGEFRVTDPQLTSLAIGGMVSWAYVWYRPKGRLTLPEVADRMSSLMLSMVGADAQIYVGALESQEALSTTPLVPRRSKPKRAAAIPRVARGRSA